ncbi:DUF11 domain-containing protein [Deinococcus aerophilus]|uniref:DUF11 domain-containing protein n=1 Tax=Deinococcus aerophilus TaxID=522488 RepID=A0ABQ2GYQ5_9DEIO|nr:DUF11 domain-containing protein [Deinococcus aerophilus]GGM18818.1 hypothetical protein GCM10010841_28670 [Deinococcus aerophilus]
MNGNIKRLALTLTALLAAGAGAQTFGDGGAISTSLPLTSVGDALSWAVGDQTLRLEVPLAGRVRLELYSPRVDQSDYRSDAYYGDEQYDGNVSAVTTVFSVFDAAGRTVATRSFTPGAHGWEPLFDQDLPAGQYTLRAVTRGNGKNTFALRLAGVSATVSADGLTVNVHSREWVPALNVTTDGGVYALQMYDGDGAGELEARLIDTETGYASALPISRNLGTVEWPLPRRAGRYTVEVRQPATARQYSNAVGFRLTRAGTPAPIVLGRVDQTGLLRVTAELLLPGGTQPTSATVTAGGQTLEVRPGAEQRVAAGSYPLSVGMVAGAQVSVPPRVTVPRGGVGQATVQIRPQVALSLESDKAEVCVGDRVTLTARATTAFEGDLPMQLGVEAGDLQIGGLDHLEGRLSAMHPGELRVSGTATRPGPLTVSATLAPWAQTRSLVVQVRPDATRLQLSREPLGDTRPGEEVTVRLKVTNTAAQAVAFTLSDVPGAGLQSLDPPTFSGILNPGESRTLSYRVRVVEAGTATLQATLDTPACPVPQTVTGQVLALEPAPLPAPAEAVPVASPPVPAAPPVRLERRSTVSLPFDAPAEVREVVLAQAVAGGADYVPGSSRLNGHAVPDPVRGPGGTLYWTVPGSSDGTVLRGLLTYDLAHAGALGALPAPGLLARYRADRSEVLQGRFDPGDLAAAGPLRAPIQASENAGAIKLPLAGSDVRIRDRISVVVEAPSGQQPDLRVGGVVVGRDRIGQSTEDGARGVMRLTYVGVPLQVGPNVLDFGGEQITVNRVGGTQRLEFVPERLIADGSSPLRVRVRALDAFGRLTSQPSVTLRSNLEPRTADANPAEADYQLRLIDGEGVLELQPQPSPTTLTLDVVQGQDVTRHSFAVTPDDRQVGVGMVSATLGLDGDFNLREDLSVQARASYEGPLAGGKLYVAADKDGLPTGRDPLRRYSLYGDSSAESVPLQGLDPVALDYDHPRFHAQYRRSSLPMDVLPVGEQFTALSARSKSTPQISGFVALVPDAHISGERIIPGGTRVLRLARGGVSAGSETLEVVTLEGGTGKELGRVRLQPNVDYELDRRTGIVTLVRALDRVDARLNEVVVLASYRLDDERGQRRLAYGAQVGYAGSNYSVGVAAVGLDGRVTFGARARYDNGVARADALLAYSGGVQVSADFGTKLGAALGGGTLSARVRYQDGRYAGLAPFAAGLNVSGSYDARLGQRVRALVDGEYHRTPAPTAGAGVTVGGSVSARTEVALTPFSVGGGLKVGFGDQKGLSGLFSAGYHRAPLDVDVVQTQPLSGPQKPETALSVRYRLNDRVTLGLSDRYTWGVGHAAVLTLDSTLGRTNYALAYDLPNAGGQGNRARFGVSTTLPLNNRTSLGLRGSALYGVAAGTLEAGAGADLNYKTDTVSATAGTDVVMGNQGFGVVLRAGISGSVTPHLSLTADGLAEFGAGKSGLRAAVGYAYRNSAFNSLGTVRYLSGTLAGGQPEVSGNLSGEYRQPAWAVRGGLDTRTLLNDPGSFTAQAALGGTAYLGDRFGVGAWGRVLNQPATGTTTLGYGLEASVRAFPGTWLTAGYNFKGFEGLPSAGLYTRQGAYLRLDLTVDETVGGRK